MVARQIRARHCIRSSSRAERVRGHAPRRRLPRGVRLVREGVVARSMIICRVACHVLPGAGTAPPPVTRQVEAAAFAARSDEWRAELGSSPREHVARHTACGRPVANALHVIPAIRVCYKCHSLKKQDCVAVGGYNEFALLPRLEGTCRRCRHTAPPSPSRLPRGGGSFSRLPAGVAASTMVSLSTTTQFHLPPSPTSGGGGECRRLRWQAETGARCSSRSRHASSEEFSRAARPPQNI